jgi:hypothetical protein
MGCDFRLQSRTVRASGPARGDQEPSSLTLRPGFVRLGLAASPAFRAGHHVRAEVAELADAHGSGPCTRKGVGVRVPSSAPIALFSMTYRPGVYRESTKLRFWCPSRASLRVLCEGRTIPHTHNPQMTDQEGGRARPHTGIIRVVIGYATFRSLLTRPTSTHSTT